MTTVGLPQSLISTLPGSYYTDPTIFAMEHEAVSYTHLTLPTTERV